MTATDELQPGRMVHAVVDGVWCWGRLHITPDGQRMSIVTPDGATGGVRAAPLAKTLLAVEEPGRELLHLFYALRPEALRARLNLLTRPA